MVAGVETWEAEALEQVKESGRTKPMVLSCKRAGGGVHERRPFLVKAIGAPEITALSLRNELLGMLLARELGLTAADPALIEIPPDVADAINATLKRYGFQIMSGTAVGSAHMTGLVPLGLPMQLPEAAQDEAAAVYAFDLLTQNPDRRVSNPNCALREGHVFPYDFEMCFSFTRLIFGGGDPMDLEKHGIYRDHLFRPTLHKLSSTIDLGPFCERLKRLAKKGRLDALVATVPEAWRGGTDQIVGHILAVASRASDFGLELMKTLA
jgi:hypothetical protein